MKLKIVTLLTLSFCLSFAQTSVHEDMSKKNDALIKQNGLLKSQLAAMLNPSQAELNAKFIKELELSNSILKQSYPAPKLNIENDSKFEAKKAQGSFIRNTQVLQKDIKLEVTTNFNRLYITTKTEQLFGTAGLTNGSKNLLAEFSRLMKENKNIILTVERNEIAETNAKKENLANEKLTSILNELKTQITDYENRVIVSKSSSLNSMHKTNYNFSPDNYNFILSN